MALIASQTDSASSLVCSSQAQSNSLPPHALRLRAGDRFRESYYWDSYWVVRGLLASGMRGSARHVLLNLLHLVVEHGHVPNGGRCYYLNRRCVFCVSVGVSPTTSSKKS